MSSYSMCPYVFRMHHSTRFGIFFVNVSIEVVTKPEYDLHIVYNKIKEINSCLICTF